MRRIALAWTLAVSSAFAQSTEGPPAPLDFQGRALVVVSDADMQASAYVDGRLGATAGEDALSVVALGRHPRELRAAAIAVSNSVAGPPVALAVTPDGRHAIVVETFAPRPADKPGAQFGDLRGGNRIQVVDLGDLERPRVVQSIEGPVRPDAVSVNADGTLVAVAVNPNGGGARTPLVPYPFARGRLGAPVMPDVPGPWTSGASRAIRWTVNGSNWSIKAAAAKASVRVGSLAIDAEGVLSQRDDGSYIVSARCFRVSAGFRVRRCAVHRAAGESRQGRLEHLSTELLWVDRGEVRRSPRRSVGCLYWTLRPPRVAVFPRRARMSASQAAVAPELAYLNPPGLANFGTFSQVATARGGKTIHVSGQVAWNAQGQVVAPGDLEGQTVQVFENLKTALAAAGATFSDLVKITTYVVDLKPEDRGIISEIRGRYLDPARKPASTMIGVSALVTPELRIEVEAVAVVA